MCCPNCCTAEISDVDLYDDEIRIFRPLLKEMDEASINGTLPGSMESFRELIARRVGFYG